MADRAMLTEKLRRGICMVSFTKVDGTQRTMPCTLKEDLLPPASKSDPASQKRIREISDAVMVVWCTDRAAWRSFRVENVTGIQEIGDGDNG